MKLVSLFLQYFLFWRKKEKKEFLGVAYFDKKVFLCVRIVKPEGTRLFYYTSRKGKYFVRLPQQLQIQKSSGATEDLTDAHDFRFSVVNKKYFLSYVHTTKRQKHTRITAISDDMFTWVVVSRTPDEVGPSCVINNYVHNESYAKLSGLGSIQLDFSKDGRKWKCAHDSVIYSRNNFTMFGERFFDNEQYGKMSVVAASSQKRGIYVLYSLDNREASPSLKIGFALLAHDNPAHVLQWGEMPLWSQELDQQVTSQKILGAAIMKTGITVYYLIDNVLKEIVLPDPYEYLDKPLLGNLKLRKSAQNPVIVPKDCNHWETVATFNPTASYIDDTVHVLYRAMGHSGFSFMGYAKSLNGIDFHERQDVPAYYPREPFEGVNTRPETFVDFYKSGGGWGGCEDGRMTRIGDYVYVTYVAFNGYQEPQAAISYISLEDFLQKNWKEWSKPQLMSRSHFATKGPCLFPGKAQGKYVVCHRVFPNILIDYVDDLNFESDEKWLEGHEKIEINTPRWDSRKIGVGGSPILTDKGWLLIYYGVDDRDPSRYMIGAMLLDKDNPHKVIARSRKPILMPEEWYEESGHKAGVAYPCGYIVKNGMLYVYYGGADTVTCVATAPLDAFIRALLRQKTEPFVLEDVSIL